MQRGAVGAQLAALPSSWQAVVAPFRRSTSCAELLEFLDTELAGGKTLYPATVFQALQLTAPGDVKVVILGQDPYHGAGQAHGLAFSVQPGTRFPPSLRNIFSELQQDLGCPAPTSGNLEGWARQGVLLLNTVFTVEEGRPQSHTKRGWEALSDLIIRHLSDHGPDKAFLLWGAPAQAKRPLIGERHLILAANHPSPLSARRPPVPFLGCRHFSKVNAWLREQGREPVEWCL